ncbi:MAG: hypothetical protein ACOCQR_00925 [bacterium]
MKREMLDKIIQQTQEECFSFGRAGDNFYINFYHDTNIVILNEDSFEYFRNEHNKKDDELILPKVEKDSWYRVTKMFEEREIEEANYWLDSNIDHWHGFFESSCTELFNTGLKVRINRVIEGTVFASIDNKIFKLIHKDSLYLTENAKVKVNKYYKDAPVIIERDGNVLPTIIAPYILEKENFDYVQEKLPSKNISLDDDYVFFNLDELESAYQKYAKRNIRAKLEGAVYEEIYHEINQEMFEEFDLMSIHRRDNFRVFLNVTNDVQIRFEGLVEINPSTLYHKFIKEQGFDLNDIVINILSYKTKGFFVRKTNNHIEVLHDLVASYLEDVKRLKHIQEASIIIKEAFQEMLKVFGRKVQEKDEKLIKEYIEKENIVFLSNGTIVKRN